MPTPLKVPAAGGSPAGKTPSTKKTTSKVSPPPKENPLGVFLSYGFLLGLLGLLIWLVLRLFGAQDLGELAGRDRQEVNSQQTDFALRLQTTLQREGELVIEEEELNRFLMENLALTQEGMFASMLEAKGVWIDLREEDALIIFERELAGNPQTISVQIEYEKVAGKREFVIAQDQWQGVVMGKQGMPSGLVRLVKPSLDALYAALSEEIALLEKMHDVRIEEGKLIVSALKNE